MKKNILFVICIMLCFILTTVNTIYASNSDSIINFTSGLLKGIINNNIIQKSLGEPAYNSTEYKRQALIETANAFLSHSKNIQYDQFRENRYATPEDATEQHKIYSVCSSFVWEIYNNTFKSVPSMSYESIKRLNWAKNYYKTNNNYYNEGAADNVKSGKYILKYYETKDEIENLFLNQYSSIQALVNNWVQFLQPGDIFVVAYQYINMGHTMMVLDVDKQNNKVTLIENSGKVYDVEQHQDDYEVDNTGYGSIKKFDLCERIQSYINKDQNTNKQTALIKQMAFLRYINDDNKYLGTGGSELELPQVSDASISRMEYKGLYVEKTSRVIASDNAQRGFYSANINDETEYTIKIKNNSSSAYSNLKIKEIIDENVVLSSYDGWNYDNQKRELNRTISLASGKEIVLKYKIKVTDYGLIGKKIQSTGNVADTIKTPTITHYIGKSLSKEQQDTLKQAYNNLLSTSKYNEGAFIDEIYKSINFNNLNFWRIANNLDLIEYSNSEEIVNKTKIKDTSYKNLFFANLYGLEICENDSTDNKINAFIAWRRNIEGGINIDEDTLKDENNRARTFLKEMLDIGDVISLYENNTKKVYMYLDNKLIRKYGSYSAEQYEEITGDELDTFLRNIIGKNYIVLRPAYAKTIENIEVTTSPSKTTYIQNYETLNLEGGKITLTYNDKSTEVIDMTASGVTTSGFSNSTVGEKTITVTYGGKSTTFKVNVVAKSLSSIKVSTNPTKTTYIQNYETLNLTGGKITLTYNDKTTEVKDMTASGVTTSGFSNSTVGEKTITVTYGGKSTTFKVNVVAKSLSSIKVSTNPTKTSYIQNYETLNLTGGKITLTYNDKSTEVKDMTASGVTTSGFSNSTVGEKTITVTYGGKSATFKVNVVLQIESEKYEINAEKIKGLTPKTTLEKFLENMTIRRKDYTIKNVRGEEIKAEELIGTGAKLKLNDEELTIVVKADVTGDGTLDVVDLSQLVLHIVEKDMLEGTRLEAANIDEDGDVDIIDLSQMVLVLVDKIKLEE